MYAHMSVYICIYYTYIQLSVSLCVHKIFEYSDVYFAIIREHLMWSLHISKDVVYVK